MISAFAEYRVLDGLTHFMLLAGVIWPNMVPSLRMAVYAASVSSLLSVAEADMRAWYDLGHSWAAIVMAPYMA